MIVYTKNRKVKLCKDGGVDFSPPVSLGPMTRVEIDEPRSEQMIAATASLLESAWFQVKVLDPPNRGKVGWIAGAGLSTYALGRMFGSTGATTYLTGRSYGGDVFLWDGAENTLWRPNCPHCGLDPESHRIMETSSAGVRTWTAPKTTSPARTDGEGMFLPVPKRFADNKEKVESGKSHKERTSLKALKTDLATRAEMVNRPRDAGTLDDTLALYEALRDAKLSGTMMIGVVHVAESDNVYAGHSGKVINSHFVNVCKALGFLYAPPVALPVLNRAGDEADRTIQNADMFQCAAPRLIQAALKDAEWPCAMTEVWFEPNNLHVQYPNKHTIESCDICRPTVPLMLCPEGDSTIDVTEVAWQ